MFSPKDSPVDAIQARLLNLATVFLFLFGLAISLAPSARSRSWSGEVPWLHWLAFTTWLVLAIVAHRQTSLRIPDRDPYLLPVAAFLSGWGFLTIWRLDSGFGLRQTAWLLVAMAVFIAGLRVPGELKFLRGYKYLWLSGGLLLTALTLVFGTNPMGFGPRLWLGCCGFYFQPSEPLKLFLVIYLAGYLADFRLLLKPIPKKHLPAGTPAAPLLPLLAPTLIMTGLTFLLLVFQRDLGTTTIFLFIYTAVVYVASGKKRLLLASLGSLALAGYIGYAMFDVVRLRVDAWLNPWADPSGRSFQIVQSLLAVANGGLFGRGPGMGNPGLVPVAHSDFIFAAVAEETGLVGALAMLLLLGLLVVRGLRVALYASNAYHRFLVSGLTAHIVAQSILIIGGNLRFLPLTGVTLPFVSYGGSSLLTSFVSLLLLVITSGQSGAAPAPLPDPRPYRQLGAFLLAGLGGLSLVLGWWAYVRGPDLLTRTDNPRRSIADRFVPRGALLDQGGNPLAHTEGAPGAYYRTVVYTPLSTVLGYTHPIYGQAGLEASLDPFLRGVEAIPGFTIWWNHLLYGQPPPGLDVRLSIDLDLQRAADRRLSGRDGALVLLNAQSGEILAMASYPGFDPNHLDQDWSTLISDTRAPLLNRVTQGIYPLATSLGPLLFAKSLEVSQPTDFPAQLSVEAGGFSFDCLFEPNLAVTDPWGAAIAAGCPAPVSALGEAIGEEGLLELLNDARLFSAPQVYLPVVSEAAPSALTDAGNAALGIYRSPDNSWQWLRATPLQVALAAATLSSGGILPAPRLAMAVDTPQSGWTVLPALREPYRLFSQRAAQDAALALASENFPLWYILASTGATQTPPERAYTWFVGGTRPDWPGTPLTLVLILEQFDPALAAEIGISVLQEALNQ